MAAMMAIIATTTINSINVKPRALISPVSLVKGSFGFVSQRVSRVTFNCSYPPSGFLQDFVSYNYLMLGASCGPPEPWPAGLLPASP